MTETLQTESFWTDFAPFIFSEERMEAAPAEIEQVLALAGVAEGDALDLCCGIARHSVELAKHGLRVTGVDATRPLLERARQRAAEVGVEIEFVEANMRDFVRPEAFDLAVNLFSSIGYLSREDDLQVMRNLHTSLRPGGVGVVETMSREVLARKYLQTVSQELPDGSLLVDRHRILDDWTRIESTWTLIRDGTVKTHCFTLNLYAGDEMRRALQTAGFGEVKLFGSLEGAPYDHEAKRLIAVARKTN